jgi:hypothetical protein
VERLASGLERMGSYGKSPASLPEVPLNLRLKTYYLAKVNEALPGNLQNTLSEFFCLESPQRSLNQRASSQKRRVIVSSKGLSDNLQKMIPRLFRMRNQATQEGLIPYLNGRPPFYFNGESLRYKAPVDHTLVFDPLSNNMPQVQNDFAGLFGVLERLEQHAIAFHEVSANSKIIIRPETPVTSAVSSPVNSPLRRPLDVDATADWFLKAKPLWMFLPEPMKPLLTKSQATFLRYTVGVPQWTGYDYFGLHNPPIEYEVLPPVSLPPLPDPGAPFGVGATVLGQTEQVTLSPVVPVYFNPRPGDDFFMENSNLPYFQLYNLVSYDESVLRKDAKLSPRSVIEELRAALVEQQASESSAVRRMKQATLDIRAAFIVTGVRPEYLPDPIATEYELVDFACSREPMEVRLRPFHDRIFASLTAQVLCDPTEIPRLPKTISTSAPTAVFEHVDFGEPVIVFPSGVSGSRGVLIRLRLDPKDLIPMYSNLERELLNTGCSAALWEYVNQSLERSDICLPDWVAPKHTAYFGKPPHSMRVRLLDLDSEDYLLKATPHFFMRTAPYIRMKELCRHKLPDLMLNRSFGFSAMDVPLHMYNLDWADFCAPNPFEEVTCKVWWIKTKKGRRKVTMNPTCVDFPLITQLKNLVRLEFRPILGRPHCPNTPLWSQSTCYFYFPTRYGSRWYL